MTTEAERVGLVLSGGGARGAYQAGALKAIVEILAGAGIRYPFPIVSGASAGALNAVFMAAWADDLQLATPRLAEFWSTIRSNQVFRTDLASLSKISGKWLRGLMFGGMAKQSNLYSLLDTKPLRKLLEKEVPFWRISDNLREGVLQAIEITATDYATSECTSFVQSREAISWVRSRRRSVAAKISLEHVMASSAIPIFFPPVQIGLKPYGDGCLRNTAPLSPALQLGATKLLIIGVRKVQATQIEPPPVIEVIKPTIARVLSVLLNAIFMDALEFDMERTRRINRVLECVSTDSQSKVDLRPINMLVLQPSEDLGQLAGKTFESLPGSIKYLFKGLGSTAESSEVASYLLFEPAYCGYLVELGYRDTMARSAEILDFYKPAAIKAA